MRILIFGAEGMLGSTLMRAFPAAIGTTHRMLPSEDWVLSGVDITRSDDIRAVLDRVEPQAVINCAGVVKSECEKRGADQIVAVNSDAPHTIARLTSSSNCRVIHLSTDCVFDGTHGARVEEDLPDATDLYGQTKAAGELTNYAHCVTLRTSFIGRDRMHKRGLLEWLLSKTGEAAGYTQAIWSGLSTHELARVIGIVLSDLNLAGLYHVSGPVISKANLLEILIASYDLPCRVRREHEPSINRSLDGSKFKQATGYVAPTWEEMAEELAGALPE